LADGILLERAGLPAVSICTDAFRVPAEAMAKAYGFPGFEFVTTAHPIASLNTDEIRARAGGLLPAILRILGVEQ
jgi:hypothetical protein